MIGADVVLRGVTVYNLTVKDRIFQMPHNNTDIVNEYLCFLIPSNP